MINYQEIPLIHNEAAHNFEMLIDGRRAFIDYQLRGHNMYLVHTEVPKELEGRGIAAAMVQKTLQYIEQHNLKLVPLCPYVTYYLEKHPEWNRLLAHN
jgi:predicted GNAT family acetyltransferase